MYQLGEDDESSQDECTLTEVSTRKQAQLPKHESWNTISCLIARVTSFFINTNSHSFMAVPSLFLPISPNMSGKLDISKNKNVVPTETESESESENEKDSGNDFGLSLEKLNLGPRKKLLLMNLSGLLLHRAVQGLHAQDSKTPTA